MPRFRLPASLTGIDDLLPRKTCRVGAFQGNAKLGLALCAVLTLSACYDKETRAESYYQSALELLAEGDEARATLEFRNVFKYNGFHQDARRDYANLLIAQGNLSGAYSQFLRLIEQYPDTLDVRQMLAKMALDLGNWDEVERHAGAAITLDPEDPVNRDLQLVLDYRAAAQVRDIAVLSDLATTAKIRLEQKPTDLVLLRVVIDQLTSQEKFAEVLPYLETALEQNADNYDLQTLKLRVLGRLERQAEVGTQLKQMVAQFPGSDDLKVALIRWFLVQQDQEGALAFLRDEAGALDAEPAGHIQVVQFLNSTQSSEAGLAELENLITANKGSANESIYAAFRATMVFESGQQQAAISELQTLLETLDGTDGHPNDIKALLARMLDHTGKRVEAAKLVDEVLAADSSNVDALKLQAGWAIAEDRINDAILSLRSALDQAPRDAVLMTMLASAHNRDGNKDLTGEYLSKAVEFSGAGSAESLRYANFLMSQGRTQGAETILADSYRAFPGNLAVLRTLGDVFLQTKQWARAGEVAKLLDQADTAETRQVAERIRAAILLMQNRIEEGLQLLETSAANDQDNMNPTLVVVLTQIRAGKTDEAREFLDTALVKFPDSESLRLLDASLYAVMGKPEQAEPAYRELIKDRPTAEAPARLLYGFLRGEGRLEDASAVLQEALTHQPDSATLLRFRAGELEQAGEIDATIDIYERLYEADSANVILANNLASMLATYRQDDASLERARIVARRLRGTTFAPFQDTVGWIQYRLNNLEDALFYLEPAASDLPNDPIVQFHLGMVYTGLQRPDAAIKQFERALELGEDRELPQLGEARAQLAALRNAE